MKVGRAGELIMFMYMCSSVGLCKGNVIVSTQFSPIEENSVSNYNPELESG